MVSRRRRHSLGSFLKLCSYLILFLVTFGGSCGTPSFDIETHEGREAIKTEVNNLLTLEMCGQAIDLISPLYYSKWSDQETRMLFAAAHGCHIKINFFVVLDTLLDNLTSLSGTGFFTLLTKTFAPPSSDNFVKMESRLQSGVLATEALFATLEAGAVVPDNYLINGNGFNPGTLLGYQRTDEASFYLSFVSMAILGMAQNRYGNPDSASGKQITALPFILEADLDEDEPTEEMGCAYASAAINMLDGLQQVSTTFSGSTQTAINDMITLFLEGPGGGVLGLNDACNKGCQGQDTDGTAAHDASCTFNDGDCNPCPSNDPDCIQCPIELRYWKSCQSHAKSSCAASGVTRWLNLVWEDF